MMTFVKWFLIWLFVLSMLGYLGIVGFALYAQIRPSCSGTVFALSWPIWFFDIPLFQNELAGYCGIVHTAAGGYKI